MLPAAWLRLRSTKAVEQYTSHPCVVPFETEWIFAVQDLSRHAFWKLLVMLGLPHVHEDISLSGGYTEYRDTVSRFCQSINRSMMDWLRRFCAVTQSFRDVTTVSGAKLEFDELWHRFGILINFNQSFNPKNDGTKQRVLGC